MVDLRSSVSNVIWPAIPGPGSAQIAALLYQLEHSQWDTPETIAARQNEQLTALLGHALRTVPYYRQRGDTYDRDPQALIDNWTAVPVLTRADVQEAGKELHSREVPNAHAAIIPVETSGSTGRPLRALLTGTTQLLTYAIAVREHLWHERDLGGKLVSIRPDRNVDTITGNTANSWGRPLKLLFDTGPSALLHSTADIDHQVDWLYRQQPTYLLSLPSNLKALANECRARNLSFPDLRGVRCYGEMVSPELREHLHDVWRVPVTDIYSAQEIGTIALQCPMREHYHIQSEMIRMEVLDDSNQPCKPGAVGRIVLTPLHNFAMPLIRYEIGDYAEVGEACPCGRGLPVIRRILGRARNLATAPDGRRFWPSFPSEKWMDIGTIRQVQLVQETRTNLVVNYVMERELDTAEKVCFTKALHDSLGHAFDLRFVRFDGSIMRALSGKYEDFVSELDGDAGISS